MIRRYGKYLLVLVLGAWLSVSSFAAGKYGKVTGGYVNLRSAPSTSASIVGGVSKGEIVEILSGPENGWLYVSLHGLKAYISASYVEILPDGAVKENPKGIVNTGNVNVRAGPSTNDARLTVVAKGTEVEILGEENGWYKVKIEFQIGYIRADLITVTSKPEDNTPSTPSTPSKPTEPSTPSTPTTPTTPTTPSTETAGTITGSVVNVRSGAGTSYSVIATVKKGDKVTVLEKVNGWYKVRLANGQVGFISADYVSVQTAPAPEPSEPTTPEPSEPTTPEQPTPEPPAKDTYAVITGSVVNVRSGPGTSYSVVGTVKKGESVVVLETVSGWYKVRLKNGQTGYISSDYATIQTVTDPEPQTKYGVITGSYVNLRLKPSTLAESLGNIPRGTRVEILGKENGWYLVRLSELTGYVSEAYVSVDAAPYQPPAYILKTPANNTTGRISDLTANNNYTAGSAIVDYAMKMLGIPYVYGGDSPATGFDCSGLTQYVFNAFGFELPRQSQYYFGRPVSKDELRPGDLLFFGPNGTINHVGIYIGNGQFIHAPNSGRPVSIDSVNSAYYVTNFRRATRILS